MTTKKQTDPADCYCVCHSPFSSCAWCEHCQGVNDVHPMKQTDPKTCKTCGGSGHLDGAYGTVWPCPAGCSFQWHSDKSHGVEPAQPVSEPSKHPDCPQGIHDYNVGKHGWCASCSQLYDKRPVVSVPAPPKPDYSYRNIKGSKGIRLNTFNNEPLELERARFHRAIDDEYDGE